MLKQGRLEKAVLLIAVCIMLPLLTYQVGDILGRYVFNAPLPCVVEIIGLAFIVVVFLPAFINVEEGTHIKVELFFRLMPRRARQMVNVICLIMGLFIFSLVVWYGFISLISAIQHGESWFALVAIPVWPSRVILVVTAVLFIVAFIRWFIVVSKAE